jgi:Tol biopolymer transport system component
MMSPRHMFTLVVVLLVGSSKTCRAQSQSASAFLPGIVSTDQHDFNACFSNDGKSFYFSRTIDKKSALFVTSQSDGKWSEPKRLSFCKEGFAYADPAFSPAGELYFVSTMTASATDTTHDYDIWKTSFQNGEWKDPVNVSSLNSPQEEYYISFTDEGDVYFSSSREGGYGEEDLYMSRSEGGNFSAPINLGAQINTRASEYDPFISNDGKILLFASSGRKDSFGKADLYWTEIKGEVNGINHFGSEVNSAGRDYCPYLHKGSLYFSSDGQVKMIQIKDLPDSVRSAFNGQ